LEKAGLKAMFEGTDKYTVFAPTDAAFDAAVAALGEDSLATLLERADLAEILEYHVVAGETKAAALAAGDVMSAQGTNIPVTVDGMKKMVDGAEVTTADVMATNGVVHVINQVMLPPTLVDVLSADAEFSTLVTALTTANLTATFGYTKGGPMYTVFAPTNAAFTALIEGSADIADADALLALPNLADILKYHVVPSKVMSTGLAAVAGSVATLLTTANLTVAVPTTGATVDGNAVATADMLAGNGVIHKMGAVLMPPAADSTGGDTETSGVTSYGVVVALAAIVSRLL